MCSTVNEIHTSQVFYLSHFCLGVVVHVHNPSTLETDTGLRVQRQSEQQSENLFPRQNKANKPKYTQKLFITIFQRFHQYYPSTIIGVRQIFLVCPRIA